MAKNFTPHRIAFYVAIIVVWQIIATAGVWPDNIFPISLRSSRRLGMYGAVDGSLVLWNCN